MERKHKEEILLLRIRNLIEQCNRYEAEQKKSPEGKNITCVHSHTEPHQTENKQDASESVFLTKAIELVEKNLHVPGYSVEQLSRDLCMERTGLYRKLVACSTSPQPSSSANSACNVRHNSSWKAASALRKSQSVPASAVPAISANVSRKCTAARPSEYAEKMQKST